MNAKIKLSLAGRCLCANGDNDCVIIVIVNVVAIISVVYLRN